MLKNEYFFKRPFLIIIKLFFLHFNVNKFFNYIRIGLDVPQLSFLNTENFVFHHSAVSYNWTLLFVI
jgi:hypothetical protein